MNMAVRQDHPRVVSLFPDVIGGPGDAVEKTLDLATRGRGAYVCFATVHMVMEAYDSPQFAAVVNGADLIVTDGMPVVWMQRMQDRPDATRVRANDLMAELLRVASERTMDVGFIGGSNEVLDALVARARSEHPGLRVAYAFSPPFRTLSQEEEDDIVRKINLAMPALLFVGLGCPKQERWMADHREKLSCVMLGVGASFDFYAGNVSESPAWMGRLGLEWFYRLSKEPRRLWRRYLILNPRFMALAARQLLRRRRG